MSGGPVDSPSISAEPPSPLDRLAALFAGRRLLAVTGAGCSTESGNSDYGGPDGSWRHEPAT